MEKVKDTIYRQDAIDIIEDFPHGDVWNVESMEEMVYRIKQLPPAPERKTGTFIGTEYDGYADGNPVFYEWKCSECGCVFEDEEPTYNFCPNCGSDNRG